MINDSSIFLTQQFQGKRYDAMFRILSSMQRFRVQFFSQLLLLTIEIDAKKHKTFFLKIKLNVSPKQTTLRNNVSPLWSKMKFLGNK
jgi:hypothetical protein